MTLNFITMSHICVDCRFDGDIIECGSKLCRLRLLEEEENKIIGNIND